NEATSVWVIPIADGGSIGGECPRVYVSGAYLPPGTTKSAALPLRFAQRRRGGIGIARRAVSGSGPFEVGSCGTARDKCRSDDGGCRGDRHRDVTHSSLRRAGCNPDRSWLRIQPARISRGNKSA